MGGGGEWRGEGEEGGEERRLKGASTFLARSSYLLSDHALGDLLLDVVLNDGLDG
jgi:hypothetical protein